MRGITRPRALGSGGALLCALAALALPLVVAAHAPSGAIFTTNANGSEVNLNHFPSKEAVYLDGGPGPGAPQTAAGLDPGTYVFQVTDPSGKTLLSQDAARCRQFTVAGGIITGVVETDCEHATGSDIDHPPARTVQLVPYANTPNNGGVYKAWVTRIEDFLLGCQELGRPGATGLDLVDCGAKTGGNAHGFIPSHSKTDNFKVKTQRLVREIDALFYRDNDRNSSFDIMIDTKLSGLYMIWTDTVAASNRKYAYFLPAWNTIKAHVEAVEEGIHFVTIPDLSALGCVVGDIYIHNIDGSIQYLNPGPQTIQVNLSSLSNSDKEAVFTVYVACN